MNILKKARKDAGYTQAQLAELADTDQESLSRYETGRVGLGIEVAIRIASVLKTDPLYLMGKQGASETASSGSQ